MLFILRSVYFLQILCFLKKNSSGRLENCNKSPSTFRTIVDFTKNEAII